MQRAAKNGADVVKQCPMTLPAQGGWRGFHEHIRTISMRSPT